jgi:predicted NBD/HSP70 family sugar kinase
VVDRYAHTLAEAVLGVAALIDPEMVVLGGGIGSNPALLGPLRAAVARLVPWPLRIETSALGARAGLVGALHHALASLPSIESHRVSARLFSDEGATR